MLKGWLGKLGIETLYIEPGSPWESEFSESFNRRFRDEFLALEGGKDLAIAKALTSIHRTSYNVPTVHLITLPPQISRGCFLRPPQK